MAADTPTWSDLPSLPEALGGQCVGTSGEWLLVAGGSSWIGSMWSGGVKQWSDRVYGLRPGDAHWKLLGNLPYPLGYAAAATWNNTLVCAGGENGKDIFRRVFQLQVANDGRLQIHDLPPLPEPRTLARAAIAEDRLFVVGGRPTEKSDANVPSVLTLSLTGTKTWSTLQPPWNQTLVIPEVAACNGAILVGGGAESGPTSDPPVYVRHAWSYDLVRRQWNALPEMPHPVAGGGSVCTAAGDWLVLGGDDGALASQMQVLREHHPGFQKGVFVFSTQHHQWRTAAPVPLSLLGSGAALWNNMVVLPGGENRPAHRSNRVLAAPLKAFP